MFNDVYLPPPSNDYLTLYVKVLDAKNIPKMDLNGLADPYCVLEMYGRNNRKETINQGNENLRE